MLRAVLLVNSIRISVIKPRFSNESLSEKFSTCFLFFFLYKELGENQFWSQFCRIWACDIICSLARWRSHWSPGALKYDYLAITPPNNMDRYSGKEKNISADDILKALDRFGSRSKTPSPIEDSGKLKLQEVWLQEYDIILDLSWFCSLSFFILCDIKNNMANICSFRKRSFSKLTITAIDLSRRHKAVMHSSN